MLQFKPSGISLPLVNFGPIAGLGVGTEAQFPDGGMGIVTAVGSKTTVQYLGTPLNISRDTKVRFTNRVLSFNYDRQGIIGRSLDPLGRPLDGRPEVVGEALPIYGGILNPTRGTLTEGFIQTGFPALDAKEPIPQRTQILWMKRPEESVAISILVALLP